MTKYYSFLEKPKRMELLRLKPLSKDKKTNFVLSNTKELNRVPSTN